MSFIQYKDKGIATIQTYFRLNIVRIVVWSVNWIANLHTWWINDLETTLIIFEPMLGDINS